MTINNIKAYVYLNQAFAVVGYGESDKEAIEDAQGSIYTVIIRMYVQLRLSR